MKDYTKVNLAPPTSAPTLTNSEPPKKFPKSLLILPGVIFAFMVTLFTIFSEDRRYLMCYTHGALYEAATGFCIAGPCKGESLYRLPVQVDRGDILVGCPEGDLSFLAE